MSPASSRSCSSGTLASGRCWSYPAKVKSCPSGWTLTGSTCTRTLTAAVTYTYSCPQGRTLRGHSLLHPHDHDHDYGDYHDHYDCGGCYDYDDCGCFSAGGDYYDYGCVGCLYFGAVSCCGCGGVRDFAGSSAGGGGVFRFGGFEGVLAGDD